MRTKALLGLAVLAVSAATCVAQNVYSLNIVGYVNKAVTANTWYLLENPLTQTDNNVTNVIKLDAAQGSPWENTGLFTYAPGEGLKAAEQFYGADPGSGFAGGWFPGTTVLAPGTGFYLYPKSSGTITFVGEVKLTNTVSLVSGFNMVGSAYPAALSLKALGLKGGVDQEGSVVFRLGASGFNPITYYYAGEPGQPPYDAWFDPAVGGGPTDGPNLDVGEGIWYFNKGTAAYQWKQEFTVQ